MSSSIRHAIIPPYMSESILRHYEENVSLLSQEAGAEREERESPAPSAAFFSTLRSQGQSPLAVMSEFLAAQRASMHAINQKREIRQTATQEMRASAVSSIAGSPLAASRREIWDLSTGRCVLTSAPKGSSSSRLPLGAKESFDQMALIDQYYREVHNTVPVKNTARLMKVWLNSRDAFNNGFWSDETESVSFGGVDPRVFTPLVLNYGVKAHEYTHPVTHYSSALVYHNQSGALNESASDVFASIMRQKQAGQRPAEADWLIGEGVVVNNPAHGTALRSMKSPGTAYSHHPILGDDPQPAHMDDYKDMEDNDGGDWGGVHINSGIPNKAFYLAATSLGGNSWEAPAKIWYQALVSADSDDDFLGFANATVKAAQGLGYPEGIQSIVSKAWYDVGVLQQAPISRDALGSVQLKLPQATIEPAKKETSLKKISLALPGQVNIELTFG